MEYKFINPEYLESVSGGDPLIIRELVDIFRHQLTEIVNEMKVLHERGDYSGLSLLAHKIKSSVSIMGMSDLAEMLKTFEIKARKAEDTASYSSYIQRLQSDCTSALIELENLVSNR